MEKLESESHKLWEIWKQNRIFYGIFFSNFLKFKEFFPLWEKAKKYKCRIKQKKQP